MSLSMAVSCPADVLGQGEHAGYRWIVMQNSMGFRCGYVGIPVGHPWHGKGYDDIDADVHGGLTFANPGEGDSHWLGFDCAHYGDAPDPELPGTKELPDSFRARLYGSGVVRDQVYVEAQCRSLCEQAARAAGALVAAPAAFGEVAGRFWHISQNNSGGSFDFDEARGITHEVIIEARTLDEASARAQDIGLYFDGVRDGRDCGCCGDRWSEPYGDGDEIPSVHGKPVAERVPSVFRPADGKSVCIHFLDGRKEWA